MVARSPSPAASIARCGCGTWQPAPWSAARSPATRRGVGGGRSWCCDGRPVAVTGSDDRTVRVWDLAHRHPVGDPLTGHTGWVRAVAAAVLADGPVVASPAATMATVRVWDSATAVGRASPAVGGPLRELAPAPRSATRSPATPAGCAQPPVLPDGRPVAVTGSDDRTVRVWDLTTGTPIGNPLTGHTSWVPAVATVVLPDGRLVAVTGSDDRTVRVWDLAT